MTYLHNFECHDKRIEKKINFTADYFNFLIDNFGKIDFVEAENYLSLFEKIIFQIKTNLTQSTKYIVKYINHELFDKSNHEIIKLNRSSDIFNIVRLIRNNKGDKKEYLENLLELREYLKKEMFSHSLEKLMLLINKSKSLEVVEKSLIFHVKIIASELYLNGGEKSELTRLFNKIFSKDINVFPFDQLLIKDTAENKQDFIDNINLERQLRALENYYNKQPIKRSFLFKIENCLVPSTFYLLYNDVEFYHFDHPKFKNLKENLPKRSRVFFDEKLDVIAVYRNKKKSYKCNP